MVFAPWWVHRGPVRTEDHHWADDTYEKADGSMTKSAKCPKCELVQTMRPTCKACGTELGLDLKDMFIFDALDVWSRRKWKQQKKVYLLLGKVLGVMIVISVWSAILFPQHTPDTRTRSGPSRTKAGFLGCMTRSALNRATDFMAVDDMVALQRFVATGLCIPLKPGMPVLIEDYGPGYGIVKIRAKGDLASVWTYIEAIDTTPVANPSSSENAAASLQEQKEAEQRGDRALRSTVGDEPGVISVTADPQRGILISLRGDMWRGLSREQKQALTNRFMSIVLQGNGNIAVPIEVVVEGGRVAVSYNNPMRMVLLR